MHKKVDEITPIGLLRKIELLKGDEFKQFVAEGYIKELKALQMSHRKMTISLAKKLGLTYLYLGEQELCGCENIQVTDHFWKRPALWVLKEQLGLSGGCGNGDQYQIRYGREVFGDECGAWHVVENRRMTPEEEYTTVKFAHVVERDRKLRLRAQYQDEPW